jgi:hypothetical protein
MTTPLTDERVLRAEWGRSSKEYRLWLEREGNGWHVRYAYGRIGMRMRAGWKTKAPVSALEAKEIQDRVWDEKMRKGYSPVLTPQGGEAGSAEGAEPTTVARVVLVPVNRAGRCVIGF